MLLALMARQPVSKELWRQLQPLIPAFSPSARTLKVSDEAALKGILFVPANRIPTGRLASVLGLRQWYDLLATLAASHAGASTRA